MKITHLETRLVQPRWCFLKVYTDTDIVGYGEPIVEGHAEAVIQEIQTISEYLKGKDPRRIEHHWQAIYRHAFYRGGPVLTSALSGIETALWDILGKSLNVPVYQLLGGACRDRIRVYAHCGGGAPEEAARSAKAAVERGFTAIKTGIPGPAEIIETQAWEENAVAIIAAMRAAVGPKVDIGIDCHGRLSPATSIRLARALEPYHPMFLEEPCLPENVDTMVTVARSTSIPIATGERLFTKWGFREVLEKQAAAVLQPDLCHAGGIFECKKIAAMAETYYAALAPHNPLGPIALAACLQLDACTPNFLCQEQVCLGEGYIRQPFVVEDGYVALPQGPGLGIELDDAAIDQKLGHAFRNPPLFHSDGSVAEW